MKSSDGVDAVFKDPRFDRQLIILCVSVSRASKE
jgi:hypothetical protein